MKGFWMAIRAFPQKHLDDLLIVAGSLALAYGVSLIYLPAGVITAGVLLIALGILVGLGEAR
jgi:hypothetical protein